MNNEPTQPIAPLSIQGQFFYFDGQELTPDKQTGKPRIYYNVFLGDKKIGFLQIDTNSPDKRPAYGRFIPIINGVNQPLMDFLCPKPKQSTNKNWWIFGDTAKEIYTAFCLDFEQQYSDTIIGQFEQIAVFASPIEVVMKPIEEIKRIMEQEANNEPH